MNRVLHVSMIVAGLLVSGSSQAPAVDNVSLAALVTAAQDEGQLNVIGLPRDWCRYGDLIDTFAARYGIAVKEIHPDASSGNQLDAIRHAKGDEAPDVIDVGLSFGPLAREQGLLQPYKVASWNTIPDNAKDPEGFWYGDYYGVLAFEINAGLVPLPEDWPDLLRKEYRGAVALAGDPLSSNQAILAIYAAGLASAGNSQAATSGLAYFADLHRAGNLVPRVGDAAQLVKGTTPILVRWDYLAFSDRDRLDGEEKIEVVVPKSGVVGGLYVQAISAAAPHPNAAKLWMEFLYSDKAQITWLEGYCHPIRVADLARRGKLPNKLMERLPEIKESGPSPEPYFPTPQEQETARDVIIRGWDDVVGVKIECPPPPQLSPRPPISFNQSPPAQLSNVP